MGQLEELQKRSSFVGSTPVYAGVYPMVFIHDDLATGSGSWTLVHETIAFPVNTVQIRCWKREGICYETYAYVDVKDDPYYLHMMNETYYILQWGASDIIAESGSESDCRRVTLRLNSAANEVTQTTTNNTSEACNALGVVLPKLDAPRIAKLGEGLKLSYAYFKKRNKEASDYISSDARDEMKALIGEEN